MEVWKVTIFLNIKRFISSYFQFIKFSIVGVLNTIISIAFYYIFLRLGLFYISANTLAYCVGMINGYILNKKLVFKSNIPLKVTFFKFIIINLISLVLSNLLLYIMIGELSFNKMIAQLIVTFIILTVNFVGNKIWTFKK